MFRCLRRGKQGRVTFRHVTHITSNCISPVAESVAMYRGPLMPWSIFSEIFTISHPIAFEWHLDTEWLLWVQLRNSFFPFAIFVLLCFLMRHHALLNFVVMESNCDTDFITHGGGGGGGGGVGWGWGWGGGGGVWGGGGGLGWGGGDGWRAKQGSWLAPEDPWVFACYG